MGAVVPQIGEKNFLDDLFVLGKAPKLRLFSNNYTPVAGTTLANLIECGFGGYSAIDLSTMAAATINANGQAQKSMANATFTATGAMLPQSAYGWYITIQNAQGVDELLMAKLFDTPKTLQQAGDYVKFDLFVYGQGV